MTDQLRQADGFASAVKAWRTFPSDYEVALLDRWLKGHIDGEHDVEARIALAVYAQREHLACAWSEFPTPEQVEAAARAILVYERAVEVVTDWQWLHLSPFVKDMLREKARAALEAAHNIGKEQTDGEM